MKFYLACVAIFVGGTLLTMEQESSQSSQIPSKQNLQMAQHFTLYKGNDFLSNIIQTNAMQQVTKHEHFSTFSDLLMLCDQELRYNEGVHDPMLYIKYIKKGKYSIEQLVSFTELCDYLSITWLQYPLIIALLDLIIESYTTSKQCPVVKFIKKPIQDTLREMVFKRYIHDILKKSLPHIKSEIFSFKNAQIKWSPDKKFIICCGENKIEVRDYKGILLYDIYEDISSTLITDDFIYYVNQQGQWFKRNIRTQVKYKIFSTDLQLNKSPVYLTEDDIFLKRTEIEEKIHGQEIEIDYSTGEYLRVKPFFELPMSEIFIPDLTSIPKLELENAYLGRNNKILIITGSFLGGNEINYRYDLESFFEKYNFEELLNFLYV